MGASAAKFARSHAETEFCSPRNRLQQRQGAQAGDQSPLRPGTAKVRQTTNPHEQWVEVAILGAALMVSYHLVLADDRRWELRDLTVADA